VGKFQVEFTIPYFAGDKEGVLSPVFLLEYLGEVAALHSDAANLGFKELKDMGYGWVLNRWKVKVDKYPKVKEKIIIKTWTSKAYKFFANREFTVYNKGGQLIGKASTLWVFIDINRKRPARIPEKLVSSYKIVDKRNFKDFYKFQDDIGPVTGLDFLVRKSDIDYNLHVNNVRYLDWILEVVPERENKEYFLKEFEIQYRQEIKYGEEVSSRINKGKRVGKKKIYLHKITTDADEKSRAFAKTIWSKEK